MDFSQKLTYLRKKAGLSQEKLAEKLEVSRQSVFKWESGENTPDIDKIIKLAKMFDVTIDSLLIDEKELSSEEVKEEVHNTAPTVEEPKRKTLSKRGFIAIIAASCAIIALSVATAICVPTVISYQKASSVSISETSKDIDTSEPEEVLDDTPDEDSTRMLTLEELNGTWKSANYVWTIDDRGSYSSILTTIYSYDNRMTYDYVSCSKSSELIGYGMGIQKMSGLLVNGTDYLDKELTIYLTKSKDGVIKMYYANEIFKKI